MQGSVSSVHVRELFMAKRYGIVSTVVAVCLPRVTGQGMEYGEFRPESPVDIDISMISWQKVLGSCRNIETNSSGSHCHLMTLNDWLGVFSVTCHAHVRLCHGTCITGSQKSYMPKGLRRLGNCCSTASTPNHLVSCISAVQGRIRFPLT